MQAILRILQYVPRQLDALIVLLVDWAWRLVSVWGGRGVEFAAPHWRRVRRAIVRWSRRGGQWALPWLQAAWRQLSWCAVLAVLALAVTATTSHLWRGGIPKLLASVCGLTSVQVAPLLRDVGLSAFLISLMRLAVVVAGVAGVASLAAFARRRWTFWIVKSAAAGYGLFSLAILYAAWRVPAVAHEMDPESFDKYIRNEMWVKGTGRALPFVLVAAVFLFVMVLRVVSETYGRKSGKVTGLGDRIWRSLVTHGEDPAYRKALYKAAFAHVFVFLILPHMLGWSGCVKPYGVPKGSGSPVLEMVRIRKIKKKIEKKYVFNVESAISFYVPKIDESEVFEEVEELTERLHEAEAIGKLGEGGGKEGGWPDGMEKAKVRFIRLEYSGGDWDQDMGFGSDYNMLLVFRESTGFSIRPRTEHIRVAQLKKFPRKRAPPFIYLTGGLKGGMHFTQSEVKTLRHYCLEMGGMIFADNGGGNFDTNFRTLLRRVFPDLPVVTISHDDVIFQQPFPFPNGAPPLWHHSGNDALGVKHRGRWVVFYHQGDINDAWKDGHSGASRGVARQAYKLGINVINYSFSQYMRINFGD